MPCSFDRIKFRRGYYWEFWMENPVLAVGEPTFTIDDGYQCLRIGDGITAWRDLNCFCFNLDCDIDWEQDRQ